MRELRQHIFVHPWIKVGNGLELLNAEEGIKEELIIRSFVNVDVQHGLESLITFGIFAHRTVVDWISLVGIVMLRQNLPCPIEYVLGVILKQVDDVHVEFFVPLDRFLIMKDRRSQLTMLNIHILESESILFIAELIIKHFLHINPFNIKQHNQHFIVSSIKN